LFEPKSTQKKQISRALKRKLLENKGLMLRGLIKYNQINIYIVKKKNLLVLQGRAEDVMEALCIIQLEKLELKKKKKKE
jgi:hypothetical protein